MDNFYVIATIVFLVVILWLLVPARHNSYYCQKCGFTSENALEAAEHEKAENTHKVVEQL